MIKKDAKKNIDYGVVADGWYDEPGDGAGRLLQPDDAGCQVSI